MRQVGSEYVADAPIGQGSTGQVWRGSEAATGRPVAIKLLHRRLVHDPDTVARFVQERSILTGIRSAHLVGVHDLVAERDTLAIVMDLVPGVDLRHHLKRVGTLAPGLAAELIGQVLSALSVVHRAGIVHRDVKPENILLDLTEPERPRALLTDFGVARIVRAPGDSGPGDLAGTLRYMAPEVARSGDASTASDLYSTGVVLYELLAGRPPFEATEPFGLLRAHELEEPPPIEGLPSGLQSVLGQLLAKRPADRPASATSARQLLAAAAVELRGLTALPGIGDTEPYDGPTIPPGVGDTIADLPVAVAFGVAAGAAGASTRSPSSAGQVLGSPPSVVPLGRPGIAATSPVPVLAAGPAGGPVAGADLFRTPGAGAAGATAATVTASPAGGPFGSGPAAGSPTVLLSNSASGVPGAGATRPDADPAGSGLATLGTLLLTSDSEPGAVPSPRGGDGGGVGAVATGGFYGDGADEPPEGRRGLIGLGLLALLTIGLILAVIAFWNSGSGTPGPTPSPSLVLTQPSASAPGGPVATDPAVPTAEAPTPTPTPTPAATHKPKPKPTVTMPSVVGLSRARATAQLEAVGFSQFSIVEGCFAGRQANHVVAQTPSAGSTVASTQATLEVQDPQCVTVPNVVGQNLTQAVLTLRAAGFTSIRQKGAGGDAFGQQRRVSGMNPKAGASVLPSQTIVLTLSTRTG